MEAAFEGIIAQLAPWGLWRTDVVALARLSLVCTEASTLARERLEAVREKELRRRVRVRAAQRFLDGERDLLRDREWTHNGHFVRTRVCVTFNGRIRVRETIHFGRSRRGFLSNLFTRDVSNTYITLDVDEIVLGTVIGFPWMSGVHMGRFYEGQGLRYGLRHLTHVGYHFLRDDHAAQTGADHWMWQVRAENGDFI
jgi:hypothetical protein